MGKIKYAPIKLANGKEIAEYKGGVLTKSQILDGIETLAPFVLDYLPENGKGYTVKQLEDIREKIYNGLANDFTEQQILSSIFQKTKSKPSGPSYIAKKGSKRREEQDKQAVKINTIIEDIEKTINTTEPTSSQNDIFTSLLKYGKFNELSRGLSITEQGLDQISTIELTDDELANLLQYYTLIYKDDYAYLKDNKTGELTLIPFNKWKLAFKRLFKMLKGFVGVLVIGKYGYEIYREWVDPPLEKKKNVKIGRIPIKPKRKKGPKEEASDDDEDESMSADGFYGGARVIKQPTPALRRELTDDEKTEADIRKWASRLGLGVSVLKNAKALYDLYKWYRN